MSKRSYSFMMAGPDQIAPALEALGFRLKQQRVFRKDDSPVHCDECGRSMTVQQVGRIVPGSLKVLCDDPTCFNSYAVELVSG